MIVLLNRSGQTCNQMLQVGSTMARGIRYKQKVRCLNIDNTIFSFFDFDKKLMAENEIFFNTFNWCDGVSKVISYIKKVLGWKKEFQIKKTRVNLITDWRASIDYDSLKIEREKILDIIHFRGGLKESYNDFIKKNKITDEIIVGVHIRRGDYEFFENGKYYYSDEEYSMWMRRLYQENPDIVFLIFTNGKIDKKQYTNLPVYITNGTAQEDLYGLSRCNYIMGPPSTFSRWAAYMGGNKRGVLKDRNKEYSFNDFYDYSEDEFYESH